jgi:hypothetical protein
MGVNANSSQNKLWILIKFGTDILSQEMTTPSYLIPTTIILTLIIIIIIIKGYKRIERFW